MSSNEFLAARCSAARRSAAIGAEFTGAPVTGCRNARAGRVKRLRRGALERPPPGGGTRDPPAAPAGIDRIAHDRVADVLEVHPDLVRPAGVELAPEQIHHTEAARDIGVGPRRPGPRTITAIRFRSGGCRASGASITVGLSSRCPQASAA